MDHQYDEKKSELLCKILTSSNNTVKKKTLKSMFREVSKSPVAPLRWSTVNHHKVHHHILSDSLVCQYYINTDNKLIIYSFILLFNYLSPWIWCLSSFFKQIFLCLRQLPLPSMFLGSLTKHDISDTWNWAWKHKQESLFQSP